MRFVVTGEWGRNRLLRVILSLFLCYVALFWVTNFVLYFGKMTLAPSSVVAYYLGDESRFMQPRSLQGLAEVAHFHLFAMGMLVMTLTHLLLFVPSSLRLKGTLIIAAFAAALLDEGSGWLVRFLHPGFAYVKVASFLTLQGALAGLIALIVRGLAFPERNAYRDSETT
ncbi:MAG: hypothetical protein AABZ30_01340 [Myxococcota bacterium]